MTALEIAGLAMVGVGLLMMIIGVVLAVLEARRTGDLNGDGGTGDVIDALARLVKALAGQRTSVILFTFGTVLAFLGSRTPDMVRSFTESLGGL